jgi:hypothetical protein
MHLCTTGVWSEQRSDEGQTYYWNKYLNQSKWTLDESEKQHLVPNLDPYNNRMFMPLAEFMRQPIAGELLHNGELMQVRQQGLLLCKKVSSHPLKHRMCSLPCTGKAESTPAQ